jgi:S1-C subfamily serine protease
MQSLAVISEELGKLVAAVESSVVGVFGRGPCGASGVAWTSDLVVTTARALDRDERLEVLVSGRRVVAERVGLHAPSDLAVLRVDAELSPLPRAPGESLGVGQLVLALSRPTERVRARLGILSTLGASFRLGLGAEFERYIESDLPPIPGASGGPLVRVTGELIGINNGSLVRGTLLTLPSDGVGRIVEALSAHGRVRRAHLGLAVQAVRLPKPLAEQLDRETALIVMSVQADSPAERAGILLGDVLLKLAAEPLSRVEALESALGEATIGGVCELELVRGGERRTISVRPEERA